MLRQPECARIALKSARGERKLCALPAAWSLNVVEKIDEPAWCALSAGRVVAQVRLKPKKFDRPHSWVKIGMARQGRSDVST